MLTVNQLILASYFEVIWPYETYIAIAMLSLIVLRIC